MCFFNITLDNKNYLQYTSLRRVFIVNDMALAQKFVKDRISQYSYPLLQLDLGLKEDIFTTMHKKNYKLFNISKTDTFNSLLKTSFSILRSFLVLLACRAL